MEINRIYSADQISVHPELPEILKDYTKAIIRAKPEDVLQFSAEYFQKLVKDKEEARGSKDAFSASS